MKIIKLLIITIVLAIMCISITIQKNNHNNTIEKRIKILEKDLKSLRAELGRSRIISHADYFLRPIDIEELQTIQNEILWRLKLEYVKTPAKKGLIKRR